MEMKGILISSVLAGIFIIALISFGSQFAVQNKINSTILNESAIVVINNSITNRLISIESGNKDQYESLKQSDPNKDSDVSILTVSKVAFSLPSLILDIFKSIFELFTKYLGISPLIISTLIGIVIIIMIMMGVSLIKRGV